MGSGHVHGACHLHPGFSGDYAFGLFEAYNTPAEENGLRHQLCVAGMYLGYSGVYQAPAVLVEKMFDRTTGDIVYSTWFSDAF